MGDMSVPMARASLEELKEILRIETDRDRLRCAVLILLGLYELGDVDENGEIFDGMALSRKREEFYAKNTELFDKRVYEKETQMLLAQVAARQFSDFWIGLWIGLVLRDIEALQYIQKKLRTHKEGLNFCRLGDCVWVEDVPLPREQWCENVTKGRFEKVLNRVLAEKPENK